MEQPSHLESFLNDLRSSGQTQGEGHFTVAREKALEKLAEFQLPFAGAWVVKAFQFFLAAGVDKPIAIQQTRRVTTLSCEAALAFTPEELEEAFFHPEPSGTRAIDHLMAALWPVGIKERRSFEIQLANATRFVLWDGGKMHIVSCQPVPRSTLTFTHQSPESSTSWLLDQIAVSRANAEVAAAIRDHCYTSPVPLTVDGRRVDGLHNCPQQGWSNRSFPLSLSFLHGDLPELQWPSGTFEAMQDSANHDMVDGGGLEGATRSLWKSLEKVRASGLALLVSAHAYPLTRSVDQRPIGAWQLDTFPSRCHWVQDGAVVHIDPLLIPPLGVSAALFVSADGLENDLTRFQLRDADERTRRFQEAVELSRQPVEALARLSVKDISSHNRKRYQNLSNGILVLAFGIGWTWGLSLATPLAVVMGIFGFMARFAQRAEQKVLLEELVDNLQRLQQSWSDARIASSSIRRGRRR